MALWAQELAGYIGTQSGRLVDMARVCAVSLQVTYVFSVEQEAIHYPRVDGGDGVKSSRKVESI